MWGYTKKALKTRLAVHHPDNFQSEELQDKQNPSMGVLGLQQSAGNQAVRRILAPNTRNRASSIQESDPSVSRVLSSSASQPLDSGTCSLMEQRFGFDFSNVRIHTDSAAVDSALSLDAHAYTMGNHVVFDKGEYAPHTRSGRWLLAHELAHVVQQSRGGLPAAPATNSNPKELAADRTAHAATQTAGSVEVTGANAPGLALKARTPDQYRTVFQANRYWQRKLNQTKDRSSSSWPYIEVLHNLWWENDPDRSEGAADRFREFIDTVWEFQWRHRVKLGNLRDGIESGTANGELTPQTAKLWRKLATAPAETPTAGQRAEPPMPTTTPRYNPPPSIETRRTSQPVGRQELLKLTPFFAPGPLKIYRAKPSPVGADPYPPFDYEAIKEAIYNDIIAGLRSAQKSKVDELKELAAKVPEPGKTALLTIIDIYEEMIGVIITIILYAIGLIVGFGTAIVQLIWGLAQLAYGILKWFALWFYGFVDNHEAYLKYTNDIIRSIKQIPNGIKKIFNDWVEKFQKEPIDRGTLMIGELFGQIIALIATFGTAASKAGQVPKLTFTANVPMQVGDQFIWRHVAVAVDVGTPAAVTSYPVVFMTGHDVPEAGGQKPKKKSPLENLRDEEIEKALEPIDPKRHKPRKRKARARPAKGGVPQIPVETVVKDAVALLKKQKISGGLHPSEYGTKLHAAVHKIVLRRTGKPPKGWVVASEQPFHKFAKIRPKFADMTVEKYMKIWGMNPRYPKFPDKFLKTKIKDLKPDLVVQAPDGRVLVWDVTSQPTNLHISKTQFYAEIIYREAGILQYLRISESYWRTIFH